VVPMELVESRASFPEQSLHFADGHKTGKSLLLV
jgi:hypothetical protein